MTNSHGIAFANGSLHAGDAGAGADGATAATPVELSATTQGGAGQPRQVDYGSYQFAGIRRGLPGGTSRCAAGANGGPGGGGGDSHIYNHGVTSVPSNGYPWVGDEHTAIGGVQYGGSINAPQASNGARGQDGANGDWSFDANGFVAGDASPGADGAPGQGGGGGAGEGFLLNIYSYKIGANGSGGGAGGCPGLAGGAGKGGGASVAALVVSSTMITFEGARLGSRQRWGGRARRHGDYRPVRRAGRSGRG